MHSNDCEESLRESDGEYDFSRAGQIRAKPVEEKSEKWPEMEFSDRLHDKLQTTVKKARESGQLEIREISPEQRAEIKQNLRSAFSIEGDRFYVRYRNGPVQIRVVQSD